MPFVATAKARKLEWQDVRPRNEEQRDAWRIATRAQPRFSAAFGRTIRSIIDEASHARLVAAVQRGDINGAVNAFPWLNAGQEASEEIWRAYSEGLLRAYSDTLAAGATEALEVENIPIEFISKAIGTTPKGGGTRGIGGLERVFSPAPFSERWAQDRTAALVQNVSDSQRGALRDVLLRMFNEGRRTESIVEQVERVVGLTARDARAVLNREALLIKRGVPKALRVDQLDRYSRQLLRRRAQNIARTELLEAQSQGITDAWRVARDAGFIESTAREQWIASFGPRTCPICTGLNNQKVPIGEPFQSDIIGEIQRPPAHNSCRCTRILVQ